MSLLTHQQFAELFKAYKARFIVIANGYVRDFAVAEDIVTDSFIALWEQRDNLPSDTNIPAYVMTTVKNKSLNWLRSQEIHDKVHKNIHSTESRIRSANITSLEACDPTRLFATEVAEIIKKEVDAMPEIMRNVFVASRIHGNSYSEIADMYGINERKVEYELQKAVQILKTALKDYSFSISAITALLIISGLE